MGKQTVMPFKLFDLFNISNAFYLIILFLLDDKMGPKNLLISLCLFLGMFFNWLTRKYMQKYTIIKEEEVHHDTTLRRLYFIFLYSLMIALCWVFFNKTHQKSPSENTGHPIQGPLNVASGMSATPGSRIGPQAMIVIEKTRV